MTSKDEFHERYRKELDQNLEPVERCLDWCRKGPLTLLFAAKDREHNQAVVLRDYLVERLTAPTDEDLDEGGDWPAGYVHIPRGGVTAEWLKQLTAEQLVTVRTRQGFQRLEWKQVGDRNEALDCRVYARAAGLADGHRPLGRQALGRTRGATKDRPGRRVRLRRAVLQPEAAALETGLPQPNSVRGTRRATLTCRPRNRQQAKPVRRTPRRLPR